QGGGTAPGARATRRRRPAPGRPGSGRRRRGDLDDRRGGRLGAEQDGDRDLLAGGRRLGVVGYESGGGGKGYWQQAVSPERSEGGKSLPPELAEAGGRDKGKPVSHLGR